MRRHLLAATVASMLALIPLTASWADVVELKTGQRVEGTLKQADQETVTVEVGGQSITFKPGQVRSIYYGAAPASAAPQPSSRDEALKALKALQSVARGGITYRDYTPRVSDAKIVVDRYLSEPGQDEVKGALADSMDFYLLASSAWSAHTSKDYDALTTLGKKPIIARCTELETAIQSSEIMKNVRAEPPQRAALSRGFALYFEIPATWSCASAKIAEADKLLGK